jgi:hypothetical protein
VSFQPPRAGPAEGTTATGSGSLDSELRVQVDSTVCMPWSNSSESGTIQLRLPSMSTVTPTFSEALAGIMRSFSLKLAALPVAPASGILRVRLTGVAALVSAGERQGLVNLYLATNGSGWSAVTGWASHTNASVDPCTPTPWTGVTCGPGGSSIT